MSISGLRSLFAFAILLPFLEKPRHLISFDTLAGGLGFAGAMMTFVVATKLTTAANAIFLQLTAPIYVALLSGWILGERVRVFDWVITCIIISGMLLFFADKLTVDGFWGNVCAIISAICWAFFILFSRRQKDDTPLKIPILGHFICTLFGIPYIITAGPPESGWFWIIPMGAIGAGLSFVLYTAVIKRLKAIEAIITQTIEPVFNPIWVFLAVGEIPGPWALLGGMVVLSSVTLHAVLRQRTD
jgi:drug/metabolite transporter (DMT)-like permease